MSNVFFIILFHRIEEKSWLLLTTNETFFFFPPIHSLFLLDFSASVWFLFKAKGSTARFKWKNGRQIRVAAALLFDKQIALPRLISFHLSASIFTRSRPGGSSWFRDDSRRGKCLETFYTTRRFDTNVSTCFINRYHFCNRTVFCHFYSCYKNFYARLIW